jgi:hypothetical protein
MTYARRGALTIGLMAVSVAVAGAQELPVAVESEYPEGFGLLSAVRELPDGRVLVADPLGQILAVIDMASGEMEIWGREGAGPQEYKQPDAVFALPGDSTLLVDLGNGRLTVIGPDGRFGKTMPLAKGGGGGRGPGALQLLLPRDVDAAGNIYFNQRAFTSPNDSASVSRFDRGADQVSTLAKVKPAEVVQSGSAGRQIIRPKPMSPQDDWAVGPDGTIALIRSDGYYVQVIHPDGRVSTGPKVDYDPIRPRDAEKEAWVEGLGSGGISVSISVGADGNRQMSFGRGGGSGGGPDIDRLEWPDRMPAFSNGSAEMGPDGRIWVGRTGRAGEPSRFDIFDSEGRPLGHAVLGTRASIVGFGADGSLYVTETDDFGLQYLKKVTVG